MDKSKSINWSKVVIAVTILGFVSFWLALGFYWYEIRPERNRQKAAEVNSRCMKEVYNRPNELNYEWAEGKNWEPALFSQSTGKTEWGWIYPGQRIRVRY